MTGRHRPHQLLFIRRSRATFDCVQRRPGLLVFTLSRKFLAAAVISGLFCVFLRAAKSLLIAVPSMKVVRLLSFYLSTFFVCLLVYSGQNRPKKKKKISWFVKSQNHRETDREGEESNLKQSKEDEKADEKQPVFICRVGDEEKRRGVCCRCDAEVSKRPPQMFLALAKSTKHKPKNWRTEPRQCLDYVRQVSAHICKQLQRFWKCTCGTSDFKCHSKTLTNIY